MVLTNEFLKNNPINKYNHVRQRAFCKDGFNVSIQASEDHRCIPCVDNSNDGYSHVELGYPSLIEISLLPYKEGDTSDPLETVYNYVPVSTLDRVLRKHGGIDHTEPWRAC